MSRIPARALSRRALSRLAALGVALSLAGCGGLGGPSASDSGAAPQSLFQRVFGSKAAETAPAQQAAAPVEPGGVPIQCPATLVRSGTEAMQAFDGMQGDPMALRWQASVTFTERECRNLGNEVGFVVGVAGRLLLGPKGQPGNYVVPVRIAVLKGGEQTLFTRLASVNVTVPAGQTSVSFTHVEQNVQIRRELSENLANVQIFVGFDPAAPRADGKKRKKN